MMRIRLLSMVLAMLLIFPATAFAELNFADYSVEDLISLKTEIHSEIIRRTSDDNTTRVPMGRYTVGVDIPAGAYKLICASDRGMVSLFTADGNVITYYTMYYLEEVGRIDLQDGQIVEIQWGAIVFSTYRGIGF